jgi:hypothetical protein
MRMAQVRIVDAAIGGKDGTGEMAVGNAQAWWGQTLASSTAAGSWDDRPKATGAGRSASADDFTAHGGDGVYLRKVTVVSLATLLLDEELVDLVHFDCQGQELPVIAEALRPGAGGGGVLDKIKAMHIGGGDRGSGVDPIIEN